ncbi:hypothetical protein AMELA_G00162800 [Ameiurus melas]|uniref:Uncharacterized protein n=1 Tax=Ameiurus melas TaxID=219545 RepID=A0A7J6AJB3_AMEME|nr:hypothetical protein AMELA_G00162800 [Ameiurus melas]
MWSSLELGYLYVRLTNSVWRKRERTRFPRGDQPVDGETLSKTRTLLKICYRQIWPQYSSEVFNPPSKLVHKKNQPTKRNPEDKTSSKKIPHASSTTEERAIKV